MAVLDMQEQEQIDALKAWWKENGKWLLLTAALTLAGVAAVRGWQTYQSNQGGEASTLYAELEKQLQSNDPKRINDAATAVMDKFSSTAYAPRAALTAAQVNIQTKDITRAKTQLQWVIDHAKESGLQNVARLKLASILLDEKNYTDALKLLDATDDNAFVGLYADLKGDVLNAQGKTEEARTAYKLALDKIEAKSSYRNLVQMKLDALGAVK
ncbi:MAG: tetratricopeptide repeat protein [Gallionellaceae bacterium]|nr:tetratricopeptide repeat protein [Gallionellaceae bacterium]